MFVNVRKIWPPASTRRRRRALESVRRQITGCGYALDDLSDKELEAAVTQGRVGIEKLTPLTARTIYWTLRRIFPDGARLQGRKIRAAPQNQSTGRF